MESVPLLIALMILLNGAKMIQVVKTIRLIRNAVIMFVFL